MLISAIIVDKAQFKLYAIEASKLVAEFGGVYIVKGGESDALEGNWHDTEKTVISKWPSRQAALAFWNSPQYAKIKKLRIGGAKVRVALLEGNDG